jgi:hypothetical protein
MDATRKRWRACFDGFFQQDGHCGREDAGSFLNLSILLFFFIPCIAWLLMSFLVAGSGFLTSDDTIKTISDDELEEPV